MNDRPLYIFDLDGTLADNAHRQHHLNDADDPERWTKFNKVCGEDSPIFPVIDTLRSLASFADIWIWTGREASVWNETHIWLISHVGMEHIKQTLMRPVGNLTPDEELKLEWYNDLDSFDKERLIAVFEDRNKVVKMWRDNNIPCFQVREGLF